MQQETEHQDYDFARKQVDYGSAVADSMRAAQIKPIAGYEAIPASQMPKLYEANPKAHELYWLPTDVKDSLDSKGKPTHETVWTAFDPNGKVPIQQSTLDQWKKYGYGQYNPGLFDTLKPKNGKNYEMPFKEFQATAASVYDYQKRQIGLETESQKLETEKVKLANEKLQQGKLNWEIKELKAGKTKDDRINKAMSAWQESGDLNTLSGEQLLAISEGMKEPLDEARKHLHDEIANPNPDSNAIKEARDHVKNLELISDLAVSKMNKNAGPGSTTTVPQTPQQAEASKISQTVSAQQKENADKDLVDDYMGSNKRLMMEATTDPTKKLIYQTLKKHDKDWNTTEKAEFIRGASNQSQNNAGLKNKPVGAAGTAKGADGKLHWASSTGQDLGLAE